MSRTISPDALKILRAADNAVQRANAQLDGILRALEIPQDASVDLETGEVKEREA